MNLDKLSKFNGNSGASLEAIRAFEESSGVSLPVGYKDFLKFMNGGEGFVGENSYLILWKVEELGDFNREYEVADYCNGLLLIGSSGGGEAYGFDMRESRWPIVRVPFVGMDHSLIENIAPSFNDFLIALEQNEQE